MKNKLFLSLVEQVCMLLLFALAAALCLQAFLWADQASRQSAAQDRALVHAQNACELLKHHRGDLEETAKALGGCGDDTGFTVYLDGDWEVTPTGDTYVMTLTSHRTDLAGLGSALVSVRQGQTVLASLEVCWQEVDRDG